MLRICRRVRLWSLIWTFLYLMALYVGLRWFVTSAVILRSMNTVMPNMEVGDTPPILKVPPTEQLILEKPPRTLKPSTVATTSVSRRKPLQLAQNLEKVVKQLNLRSTKPNKLITIETRFSTTTSFPSTTTPEIIELGKNDIDKEIQLLYGKMLNGSTSNFIPPRRVVHFDLKGGPLRPSYFQKIFPILKQLGGTSVLLEWEDMFPYKGILEPAVNGLAYSEDDIKTILNAAVNENIEVIPLVQTMGHLEWILKLDKFAHLRENSGYPQVICFGKEEAWELLISTIDQVAEVHKQFGLPFFHIGADEAFQIGSCQEDRTLMTKERSKERLILWHIARVAQYIRDKHDTRVLAWHDMFQNARREDLLHYKMPSLVEPVIWNYAERLEQYLPYTIWGNLKVFPFIWAASAFKGADGPSRYYANPMHYVRNHQSWIGQMNMHWRQFRQFRGIILTGWSRYDHFAILCELFPVGFPSLALSLSMVTKGIIQHGGNSQDFMKIVGCKMSPEMELIRGCTYPGYKIYEMVQDIKSQRKRLYDGLLSEKDPGYEFHGWFSRTNIRFKFSSAWYLDRNLPKLNNEINTFQRLRSNLQYEMSKVLFPDAIEEFLYENIDVELEKLNQIKIVADQIKNMKTFPKRPFHGLYKIEEKENKDSFNISSNFPKKLK